MKKFLLTAIAATVAVGPIAVTTAEAQTRQTTVVRERPNGTVVTRTTTRTNGYRNWRTGQRFDRRYARDYRRVNDWRGYRLAAPGRGQYWARSGRDAVLVRPNGTIVSVRTRVF
ncbi:RcnB family protein [Sphingomonas rubra]|uniref:Regulator RcnB of Ni and Co efflux n=1 Tax=Sphingomonas rubra TaxID=634430 RepID=A0A1I5Q1W8_9SPHN|nr:RcnB family protein [Sphingomonas rubra]SFP39876.1 regulator RcnB of Ni and Co efflux [Sphingomonas rubra]